MNVSKGSVSDNSNLIGRVARIEHLLSAFQQLEVEATITGRGMTKMDVLARPSAPGTPSGFVLPHPFEVLDASNEEDGVRVYVRPGFIQSEIGWADTFTGSVLNDSDPLEKFYLPVAASGFVIFKSEIEEDSNRVPTVDDMTVIYATSVPANTATASHLVVAVVATEVVESELVIVDIFQVIKSNLLHSVEFEPYSVPDYWRQLIGPSSPAPL